MRLAITLVALALCIACVSAATCSSGSAFSFSSTSAVGTASKLAINNKLNFNAQIQYVYTSGSSLGVDVSGCVGSDVAKLLGFSWSTSGDTITLSAAADGTITPTGAPGQVSPNAASKSGLAPLTMLMALVCGMMLVFRPKSVSSVVLILAVLGVAVYAHADTTNTITIKITVPDSIVSVCPSAGVCESRNPGNVAFINVLGDRYATMDQNTACNVGTVLSLPSGWRIAAASDSSVFAAIAFNSWNTDALILADGTAYTNHMNNVAAGTGAFTTVDNGGSTGYQVTSCNRKILIVQKFAFANTQPDVVGTLSVSAFVTFNGYDYAAADNTKYSITTAGSQAGGILIPTSSSWQVSTDEDATIIALASASNFFGCACSVYASGKAYTSTFAACGTAQLISVSTSAGTIVGTSGSNQRVVLRRSSSAANTWSAPAIITNSWVLESTRYAVLDNVDPFIIDSNNCQGRFYSLPTGWTIATSAQLSTFIGNSQGKNIYTNTSVFVSATNSQYRDNAAATVNMVTKTVNGVAYYNTDACGRVLILQAFAVQTDFSLNMRLLFVSLMQANTSSDVGEVNLVKTIMQATGTPYDWVYLIDTLGNNIYPGSLPLYDAAGNPKYYGIIMSVLNPKFNYSGNVAEVLSANQKAQIEQYMYQYGVRRVALNGYPTDYTGVTSGGTINGVATSTMTIDTAFASANAALFSGIKTTAVFTTANQYFSWVGASTGTYTFVPFAQMKQDTSDTTTKNVAGIFTAPTTNIKTFQFFVGNADFLDHGPVLANVWLTWVTRGTWIGNRRIYFSPQIDDYYLSTGQYAQPDTAAHSVRIKGTDMDATWSFLTTMNTQVPAGSHINLVMAVNCAEAKAVATDTLWVASATYKDKFFWESHTWSHKDLTENPEELCDFGLAGCHDTNYTEAHDELQLNNDWVATHMFPLNSPNWSNGSMITPAITGLFNDEALQALFDIGMTCVVGDNSRPELVPENPYLGMYTTWSTQKGIFIIPRYATEIYYNCATPEINMQQYNERYGPNRLPAYPKQFFAVNSTLDDLLEREAQTNFRHLAFFRHDPYMFHQCNLNHFSYSYKGAAATQWSLVTLWLQSVIDRYNTMLTFPLIGVKQQDLRDVYFARRSRETCGVSGTVNVVAGTATSVTLSSTGSCEASLTGPTSCGTNSASTCRLENYAQDSTVWAQMVAGSGKQIPISTAWSN